MSAPSFDIGIESAIYIDGRDATGLLNEIKVSSPQASVENTTFRPPGRARRFLAGLESSVIGAVGFLPLDKETADILLKGRLQPERSGQIISIGVGGFVSGHMILWGRILKTNLQTSIMPDALIAAIADWQITTGSPGLEAGLTLYSSHGLGAYAEGAVYRLTFSDVPELQSLAIRKAGGAGVSAPFTLSQGLSVLQGRIEALYGVEVLITGALDDSTDTDTDETIYTGELLVTFLTVGPQEAIEFVSGAVFEISLSGNATAGTVNGADITLGDSAATVQGALRGTGGDYSAVVVAGKSS